jgi:hypothetical protein
MFKDAFEFRGFLRIKMNHEFSELEKYYTSDNEYDKNDFMTANEYVPLFWFLHFIINYYYVLLFIIIYFDFFLKRSAGLITHPKMLKRTKWYQNAHMLENNVHLCKF